MGLGVVLAGVGAMLPLAHGQVAAPSLCGELQGGGKLGEVVLAQLPADLCLPQAAHRALCSQPWMPA